jgi:hypothetical protein
MAYRKPILVTGIHRSGSTWLGKIISYSKEVRYVFEPFNISMKSHQPPFKVWFKYVSNSTNKKEQKDIRNYIKKFISIDIITLTKSIKKINNLYRLKRFINDSFARIFKRSLIKDPLAVFSAEWLYQEFDCDVIVLIRHPAAFVLSIKEKKWHFNFEDFIKQTELLDEKLVQFRTKIEAFNKSKKNLVDEGILLWNCVYSVVNEYKELYDNKWYFIRHEDLSRNSISEFEKIFSFLNLEYSDEVKYNIKKSTTASIEKNLMRNSKANIDKWKNHLTIQEINKIKEETKEVWNYFYSESDWA